MENFKSKQIYLFLFLFGIVTALLYYRFQPPNNFHINPLADANEYEKIYDFIHGNSADYAIRFGFHNRVLIPFLAGLIPAKNISTDFFILNTFFALLSLLALVYLFRFYAISDKHIALCLTFFSLHWIGPFRQNAINSINVDMAVYFFEVLFLILFIRKKYVLLLILTPIAIATKEVFLALVLVFLCIALIWNFFFKDKIFSIPWISGIVIIGVLTKMVLNYHFPSVSPDRNSLLVMAFHFREMALHPVHAIRWILSLFAAFGAFLFVSLKKPKDLKSMKKEDMLIHLLSLSVLTLSFLGGMDYTRLIFLGFPYVMISILKIGKPTNDKMFWAFILSIVLTRFWMILPAAAGDVKVYSSWMPEYAAISHLISWSCAAFLFLILYIGGMAIWSYTVKTDRIVE